MGLRFHKSIKTGGGSRVNISKSGVSFSWGIKGLRFCTKPNGVGGCLVAPIVWLFQLMWWMVVGMFWLMWWMIKICFILPIKWLIGLFSKKTDNKETPES